MSGDLVTFLAARLDEDEAAAKACADYDGNLRWFDSPVAADAGSHTIRTVGGNRPVARIRNVDSTGDEDGQRTLDPHAQAAHIARHDPARVLREVEAKRSILALHEVHSEPARWGDSHSDRAMRGQPTGGTSYWCNECDHDRDYGHIGGPDEGCRTLRQLAAVYGGHPGYDPAWAPGATAASR